MSAALWIIISVLFSAGFLPGRRCLNLTELTVPLHANLGETVTLYCHFDLGRATLYSVKWYKNEDEFYRYMPDNDPKTHVFSLPGIRLDVSASNMSQVTLTQVGYTSSGTYRCEVSTEAPNFETSLQSKNMTVLAYPDSPPQITGIQDTYSITDEHIAGNCTSGRSNPAPVVSWYVNGVKARSYYTTEGPKIEHDGGLYSRSTSLKYPLNRLNLDSGLVYLNCTSSVGALPSQSTLFTVRVSSPSANQKLAQQGLHNSVAGGCLNHWPLLLVTCLAALS
ncbi:uncharacterized protein [Halyomorpha halys]|uniref:uncharacterized protein n=1 Tax=Halyomorpha halys TaxID=286706 RepID=UPI0006D4E856